MPSAALQPLPATGRPGAVQEGRNRSAINCGVVRNTEQMRAAWSAMQGNRAELLSGEMRLRVMGSEKGERIPTHWTCTLGSKS